LCRQAIAANVFGKRKNGLRMHWRAHGNPVYALTAHGLGTAAPVQRGLLGVVMAWQWSVPAFRDGMTGQPIWSLPSRARSARCAGGEWPQRGRSKGVLRWRAGQNKTANTYVIEISI